MAIAAWLVSQRPMLSDNADPWDGLRGWRMNRPKREVFWIEIDNEPAVINLEVDGTRYGASIETFASADARRHDRIPDDPQIRDIIFDASRRRDGKIDLTIDDCSLSVEVADHLDHARVFIGAHSIDIKPANPLLGSAGQASVGGSLNAPMPGTVTAIMKSAGDQVEAGEILMVMEAMKMEHAIKAPHAGTVTAFRFEAGQQVAEGALLVEFEADD